MGMTISTEQYIRQALQALDRLDPLEAAETCSEGSGTELGEALLRRLNRLADRHIETMRRLEQLHKELGIFKEVNADSNRMLEQKIEEISLLRLITDAAGHAMRTEGDPLRLILWKVIEIAGAESGSLMLRNGEATCLEIRAADGNGFHEPQGPRLELIEKVAAMATDAKEPVFVDDVQTDPRIDMPPEKTDGIGAFASFPLIVEDRTVGVLNLSSPHPNAFGAETQRIMLIIASQIAVAIENARLYAEVKETKEYLEDLVGRAGDAILTLDRDQRILSWNRGAETIFKREKETVLGETLDAILPESMLSTLREKVQSIFDSENIITIECDLEEEDREATRVTITLSPIRGADGDVIGVSGIAKDISKRRRLEEELRQLNEAKSSFVSTVSHELRTPLTSIKSLTELLAHEMDSLSEDTVARYLKVINEECDHLSGLITGLLDLQKLTAGKLETKSEVVQLAEIVRQTTELFEGVALQNRTDLNAYIAGPDHATAVMGDRSQLLRILSNLLSNAIKYTNPGDTIEVRLLREGEHVKLTVIDTGIGIPEEQRDKVFESFYRVEDPATRSKGGTGLGLAITKELVTLHGGRIWVENGQRRGSSFNVLLPAAEVAPR